MSEKPTLANLRDQYYFDIPALAGQAGVDISVLQRILLGQPVKRYQAELVIMAFAEEFGEEYSLDTIAILLLPEDEEERR